MEEQNEVSKNAFLLSKFTEHCISHPHQRFWQSLREWSGADSIISRIGDEDIDTFYWIEKDK